MKAIDPKPMGEYIDKTEAMRRFKPFGREIPKEQVMAVLARIDEGIVRCKNCKHAYKRKPINKTAVLCELFVAGMKDNDFCSHGERSE